MTYAWLLLLAMLGIDSMPAIIAWTFMAGAVAATLLSMIIDAIVMPSYARQRIVGSKAGDSTDKAMFLFAICCIGVAAVVMAFAFIAAACDQRTAMRLLAGASFVCFLPGFVTYLAIIVRRKVG